MAKAKDFKGKIRLVQDHLRGVSQSLRRNGGARAHKYAAKATKLDGYRFDSKAESERYANLMIMARIGKITRLQVHPSWYLDVNDIRICRYEADFSYVSEGMLIVEDVKGMTKGSAWSVFKTKAALMYALHGIRIYIVTKGKGGSFKGELMTFKAVK